MRKEVDVTTVVWTQFKCFRFTWLQTSWQTFAVSFKGSIY